MEETKEKEKMKLSTIRIVVISESRLLIIRHKQKLCKQIHWSVILIIFCFCSQNVSSGKCLLICCISTRREFAQEYVCACMCVRTYVCRGCCNINDRIKIDTEEWVDGSRLWRCKIVWFESQHDKPYQVVVRPAKTQISLGGWPDWPGFSLGADHFVDFVMRRLICNLAESNERARYFYTDRSKAVLLLWFLTVLAVCVYTLVHLLCLWHIL